MLFWCDLLYARRIYAMQGVCRRCVHSHYNAAVFILRSSEVARCCALLRPIISAIGRLLVINELSNLQVQPVCLRSGWRGAASWRSRVRCRTFGWRSSATRLRCVRLRCTRYLGHLTTCLALLVPHEASCAEEGHASDTRCGDADYLPCAKSFNNDDLRLVRTI